MDNAFVPAPPVQSSPAALAMGTLALPEPPRLIYDPGYDPPKKPDVKQLFGQGTVIRQKHQRLLDRYWGDRLWMRMAVSGMFDEDILKREAGGMVDAFQSTKLVADWNTICSFLAGLPYNPKRMVYDEKRAIDARKMQDAVRYIREETIRRHADAYGTDLPMDEARILTTFGRLVARVMLDFDDADFPPRVDLLDPSTVFFRGNDRRPTHAYHLYQTTYGKLVGTFGEPGRAAMQRIKNDHGSDEWEDCQIQALDYWDTWHRAVVTGDAVFLPVTAHKYGLVPFVQQLGPFGESPLLAGQSVDPLYSSSAQDALYNLATPGMLQPEQQGLSYVHYLRREHEQFESILTRVLASFKRSIDPAVIYEQDMMNAGVDRPELELEPGMINTVPAGDRVTPMTISAGPTDTNTMLTAMTDEQKYVMLPPIFGGYHDASNVSGSAANAMTDAGMDKASPWQKTLERFHGRVNTMLMKLEMNFGDDVGRTSLTSTRSPFVIPTNRPRPGDDPTFELTPDLIQRIGPRIEVSLSAPRKQEKLAIANTYAILTERGWATDRQAAEALGETDFDRMREEWMEDKALKQALDHPKFVEAMSIPLAFKGAIDEADGNPELKQSLQMMLMWWMQNIALPAQMPQQPQMMGQPMGQPGMPGQPPQMGGQPPMQVGPGGGPGVSFQDMGQGPGSVTGQQGGQPGPPPPPPGSIVIPPGQ